MVIPVFIPHLGCGQACVFCNQRKIAGEYDFPKETALLAQILRYRESRKEGGEIQLAFYGGSFTGLSNEVQEELLGYARGFKQAGLIDKIRLSTRPDYIDEIVIDRLARYGVDSVELGVQSLNDEVLLASKRGHTAAEVKKAVAWLREIDLSLGLQMMVALPGDTPQFSLETAEGLVDLAPDFVRIYPTAVIKETELASLWQRGLYQVWNEDVLLDTLAKIVHLFDGAGIPIVRIGLQATDNLVFGADLLAGAYHPAMGELVKGRLFRIAIKKQLADLVDNPGRTLVITCHPRERSQVVGQKKCNLAYFSQDGQRKVVIECDEQMVLGQVLVAMR